DIVYLGSPTHNGAAEMAAIHLLRAQTRSQVIYGSAKGDALTDDFYRLVIEAAFGFFGSLILNPRRKCDLPEDHARRLRRLRASWPQFKHELEERAMDLKLLAADRGAPPRALHLAQASRSAVPAVMMSAR